MLNVLVTMRFDQGQLDRLRGVSPEIRVSQADPETADYGSYDTSTVEKLVKAVVTVEYAVTRK